MTSEDVELSKIWMAGWVLRTDSMHDHLKVNEFCRPLTEAFVAGRESLRAEVEAAYARGVDFHGEHCDAFKNLKAERRRSRKLLEALKWYAEWDWSNKYVQAVPLEAKKAIAEYEASRE